MEDEKITVVSTSPLSPHKKALYEAGAALLKDSISTGREYCKQMISTCFAAVPVYIALIGLFIPKEKLASDILGNFWLVPVVLFLAAAAVFSVGFIPRKGETSLNLPEQISEKINNSVRICYRISITGLILFSAGIISGVLFLFSI